MWGIVIGMALIFSVSLQRYQYRIARAHAHKQALESDSASKQEVHDALRDRYGL
jgi:hypothetical protein